MVKDDVLFHFVLFIDILLCIAIIACNLALLLSILASKAARARVRNVMLVGICLADLLLGAFTHPVYIHSYRTGTMFQSCEMHVLLQLVGDYSQDFVCFWTLVTVGGWYVYRLVGDRWGWRTRLPGEYGRLSSRPPYLRFCDVVKRVLLVGWPWLAVLTVPVPILMTSVDPHTQEMFWDETFCPLHITFPARIAVLVLVFYLPMAALTMLVVGIGLASCSSAVNPHHAFSRPAESLVENDALCGRAGPTSSLGIDPGGGAATFATSSVGVERGEVRAERGACSNSAPSSHRTDVADAVFMNAQDAASAPEAAPERNFNDDRAAATAGSGSSVYGRGVVGGAIGVGRPSVSEADGSGADLERPLHMAAPLLVTLVCALPLMIGWWFYDDMERNTVIVVAVSLHRLYLLRAAVLPLSWYLLPDVRKAFTSLTERALRRCGCPGGPLGERGEFSVAYSTLQESRDASTAPETAAAATGAERRHNPFNETETV